MSLSSLCSKVALKSAAKLPSDHHGCLELGRYFPIRSDFDVIFEATLDGKALQSDPVRHKATIHVENELVSLLMRCSHRHARPLNHRGSGLGDYQESTPAPPVAAHPHQAPGIAA